MPADHATAMPARFPAAVVRRYGRIDVEDIPAHPVTEYDAIVRIEACSICAATDTHLLTDQFPKAWYSGPPFVIGHESAGRVVAVGSKVRTFKVGQMVVHPMWWPPGTGGKHEGLTPAWGGFSSWGIAYDTRAEAADTGKGTEAHWMECLPLPEMPARDVTLFVTLRDCMSCLLQMGVKNGDKVAVFGTGGNGLAFTRFATLLGAKVVVVGSASRFDRARKQGAIACVDYKSKNVAGAVKEALGGGADTAIEAVGTADPLNDCAASLRDGGKVFVFGITADLNTPVNAWAGPSRFVVEKKACNEWQAHGHVLTYYLAGAFDPNDFTDGVLPLSKINDAFDAIKRKEAVKLTIALPH